jgi:flagellar protein FlaG
MDTGAIRPSLTAYAAVTPATRAPEQTESAARSELPVSQTVKPSGNAEEQRSLSENGNGQSSDQSNTNSSVSRDIVRKNMIDPESQSFIYVAMDRESGEVVQQIPSETLRKLRAYAQATDEQNQSQTTGSVLKTA